MKGRAGIFGECCLVRNSVSIGTACRLDSHVYHSRDWGNWLPSICVFQIPTSRRSSRVARKLRCWCRGWKQVKSLQPLGTLSIPCRHTLALSRTIPLFWPPMRQRCHKYKSALYALKQECRQWKLARYSAVAAASCLSGPPTCPGEGHLTYPRRLHAFCSFLQDSMLSSGVF